MESNLSSGRAASQKSGLIDSRTPKEAGYYFPAEFSRHAATWLSWPHKEASWPGKIDAIYPVYAQFIRLVAEGEKVNINVADEVMKQKALQYIV
ncbi:MAG TPA: agmatine deiminase family protein, partial [Ohtaekwangia sp.]|nr:agmatine deiminase family protein [Ohtaekwangia sp.]